MNLNEIIERRRIERERLTRATETPKRVKALALITWHYLKFILLIAAAAIAWSLWIVFAVVFGAFFSQSKTRGSIR